MAPGNYTTNVYIHIQTKFLVVDSTQSVFILHVSPQFALTMTVYHRFLLINNKSKLTITKIQPPFT